MYLHFGISITSDVTRHFIPRLDKAPFTSPLVKAKNWKEYNNINDWVIFGLIDQFRLEKWNMEGRYRYDQYYFHSIFLYKLNWFRHMFNCWYSATIHCTQILSHNITSHTYLTHFTLQPSNDFNQLTSGALSRCWEDAERCMSNRKLLS